MSTPDPSTIDWVPIGNIGAPGSAVFLGEVVLTADAPSIDFSNIPQGYKHLILVGQLRGTASGNQIFNLRFNNDVSAVYAWEDLAAVASTPSSGLAVNQTSGTFATGPGSGSSPGYFSSVVCEIPYYAGPNIKNWISRGGDVSISRLDQILGSWAAAAINRITVFPGSGNLLAGSRVSLYALTDWVAGGAAAAPSGPRILRGAISGAGAITNGTGFTVSRAGVGQYAITFTTPFAAIPVVVATPGPYYAFPNISAGPSASGVSFTTVDNSFNFKDSPLNFIAMDP